MAGSSTKVTTESTFQALLLKSLPLKDYFKGCCRQFPKFFLKSLHIRSSSCHMALGCSNATFAPRSKYGLRCRLECHASLQDEEACTHRLFLWQRSLRWVTFAALAAVKSAVAAVELTDNIQNKVGQPQPQRGEEGAVQPVVSLLQVVPCRAIFLM